MKTTLPTLYRHLLVPIDGSPLAIIAVERAVAFAQTSGARLSFMHARPDYAADSDGALLHSVEPSVFAEAAAGNARAILAKAEAEARSAGLTPASIVVTSDRPHEAILETAEALDCDLIFIARRRRRGLKGLLQGSVSQKVLQESALPVLLETVDSTQPPTDEQRAVRIIKNEHRSLAAVIHGLQHILEETTQENPPDFELLRAMLFYIEAFPERLHHPKEDAYLFRKLRLRCADYDELIAELERQHVEGSALFTQMSESLEKYAAGLAGGEALFNSTVAQFVESHWRHMGAEESLVLPAASRHLLAEDWTEIARAFGENGDPRFDTQTDASFAQLFERLMNFAAGELPHDRSP